MGEPSGHYAKQNKLVPEGQMGFSDGSVVNCLPKKETAEMWVQSLGREDLLRRKWQPMPVFLPGKFHGQRNLASYSRLSSMGSQGVGHNSD